ncbi:MAG TPA: ABC-type transport auxiliary lipoprotein family protein, partial [Candidatus Hydrogenedentes bacterium]|nr:ABC-type transport auxiliary lipoprotein family protein [Candidatus Hydrogenedentota bacterium]
MGKTVLPGIGRRKAAMPAALALGVLVCAAAGCVRSAETRFYQLDLTPSGAVAGGAGLEIGRLEVADDLARRDILVQKDATEIEYYADAQWAV